jgi:hypothetical protein
MSNDFLPFATGSGANVLSQAAYAALAALGPGFASGVAQSAACNKAWRQSSIMSAVVAQLIVDNTGQNATDDGTTATLLANLKKAVSGRLLNIQVFTSSGTYTPTIGTNSIEVEVLGGGGGGGGAVATSAGQGSIGGGGWSGAFARSRITSGFTGVTITVGAGGAVSSGNAGGTGGTSSFGALITAPGGPGGGSSIASSSFPSCQGATSASMAAATGGSILNTPGNPSTIGIIPNLTVCSAGAGAGTMYGSGGYGVSFGTAARSASGFGAGGGGAANQASSAATPGGSGAPGIIIIKEYA